MVRRLPGGLVAVALHEHCLGEWPDLADPDPDVELLIHSWTPANQLYMAAYVFQRVHGGTTARHGQMKTVITCTYAAGAFHISQRSPGVQSPEGGEVRSREPAALAGCQQQRTPNSVQSRRRNSSGNRMVYAPSTVRRLCGCQRLKRLPSGAHAHGGGAAKQQPFGAAGPSPRPAYSRIF